MLHVLLRSVSLAAFAAALCVSRVGAADKLDDFKSAASQKGCGAIPYSSERDDCNELSAQVQKFCKTNDFSCDKLGTKGLISTIEDMKKGISSLESKGEKQKAEDLKKKLTEKQRELEDNKKEIEKRLAMATACLTSRKSVQTLFDKVKSKVKGESDKELKPHADKLISHYESETRGHSIAIDNYEDAVDICKKSKSGSR